MLNQLTIRFSLPHFLPKTMNILSMIKKMCPYTRADWTPKLLYILGVDESGFLETNWRHGTKLGQFWDSDFLAISRAEMLQKLIDIDVLIDLYKTRSLLARK